LLTQHFAHIFEAESHCGEVIHKVECFCRYNMYREQMINVMTLLTLVLLATLQFTLPPAMMLESAETRRNMHLMMYWTPMVVFESSCFRVSR
jgi:hypothetical protein